MPLSLCIHSHLYQPPREDPWLGNILTEAGAAPMRHWNERILRESYAPLAYARRLDGNGCIADIMNCYAWMSFNVGPTLVQWLRRVAPETLERMRAGDAASKARLGCGNAVAQVYHHVIMPLASPLDRTLEVRWAVDDFRFQFRRDPEGMWLSECAVDLPSLETLAAEGIRFVILAPRQAAAVVANGKPVPVNEGSLNIGEPYTVNLPSGKSITAVFYHGGLSQGIAFEGLLGNGDLFQQRLLEEAEALRRVSPGGALLTLATDGETYGHHAKFGEMALAYVLAQAAEGKNGLRLTNLPAYIAANPPKREVLLHEPSSWSCVHGIERWRSNCGCSDGGHSGWNQAWRGGLRDALNVMRRNTVAHYAKAGDGCFSNPEEALLAYGKVLADPGTRDAFAKTWFTGTCADADKAWKLLAMQEQSLAAFASCAWFFDDISRIEPENALTFALHAMELMQETGGPDIRKDILPILEKTVSNRPEAGTGKDIFLRDVEPRSNDPATLCLLTWLFASSAGKVLTDPSVSASYSWPNVSVELFPQKPLPDGYHHGTAVIRGRHEEQGTRYIWRLLPPSPFHLLEKPSVLLAQSTIYVRREGDGPEKESRLRTEQLSPSMRAYLLNKCLANREEARRPELSAAAGHAASLIIPWSEAQRDVPEPDLWAGIVPYLAVECMCAESLRAEQRGQLEKLLALHFAPYAEKLAARLIREVVLDALKDGLPAALQYSGGNLDATLAVWVRRVGRFLPGMDWWPVKNALWDKGIAAFPALAAELGFCAAR